MPHRVFNFSAGPATLPAPVLRQAQAELLDWHGLGVSVAEISHRSAPFIELAAEAEADLRTLLSVPDDYAVLFMQGGATLQQALIPLNFAAPGQAADYLVTGHWGQTALKQARPCVDARVAASGAESGFREVPARGEWRLSGDAAYLHVTANETIHGVELRERIEADAPVFADFSSSIASEPVEVRDYGLIYAGAQKNLGPSGIAVVIIRRALLARAGQPRAEILAYASHAARDSMLNTPPTFNWYLLGLCLKWMLAEGGVEAFGQRNAARAARLYAAIDGSGGFYRNEVAPAVRSRMNVPFFLHAAELDAEFLRQAGERQLIGLKGHKVVGGMRASLYNALPDAAVDALIDFMREFQKTHG
ncbi:3-phosphoserine/phosphohydroxythreonine transaminase [Lysobacter pythonis]|uniref:Phosphoserine aminotransferase n=1 Tax=Solilutibacter pythonis TaxID=2483112 RepID=A0A3M2I1A0_9GAMM|nr:3-phosphoserine/phosphohydroxythreonine transaminase [Lysobacter pythonis]RMH94908.1 3-phosphoserine/phosphohydroxythreonine transaminase [Lysobacter pythonis]